MLNTPFDDWYHERCGEDAAELVGPNSYEYEAVWERLYEDENRREAYQIHYNREHA